jgi:hypothetical protein
MTNTQIYKDAFKELLAGAESHAEDWIDEDGKYDEDTAEQLFEAQMHLCEVLKDGSVQAAIIAEVLASPTGD